MQLHRGGNMKKRKGLTVRIVNAVATYRLYNTDILDIGYKWFILNTGGFKTNHTKNCMNDNLPDGYKVYQENFVWYVKEPNGDSRTFKDNMKIELV